MPKTAEKPPVREQEQKFHVFRLLGVILAITGVIAVICYGLQIYYLGSS